MSKEKVLDYRELAILVLQRFGLSQIENLPDEELLMEFSKFSDDKTRFDVTAMYPSGDITKSKTTTRFEGIIWASLHAPEFVKVVINDNEFLSLWNKRKDMFIDRANRLENFNYVDMIIHILDRKGIYNEDKNLRLQEVLNFANEIFIKNMVSVKNPPNFIVLLKELSIKLNYDLKTMFNNLDVDNKGEIIIKT